MDRWCYGMTLIRERRTGPVHRDRIPRSIIFTPHGHHPAHFPSPALFARKAPFITSLNALDTVQNVVGRTYTNEGRTGWVECSPFWTINGETQETCFDVGEHTAKTLLGYDPLNIEGDHRMMDRLIFGNTSVKSAFDIALHDRSAQHADLPLWKFLGAERCFDLVTDHTVSLGDPEKRAADAEMVVAAGFTVIKVKLGGTPDLDIRRIRAVREKIG